MEKNMHYKSIVQLVNDNLSSNIKSVHALPITASNRQYFRLTLEDKTSLIAAFNEDVRENEAFFSFAENLKESTGKVPKVLAISKNRKYYIQTDLGKTSLYSFVSECKKDPNFEEQKKKYYQSVIKDLICFQTISYSVIDFSKAYPRPEFDRQAILWDLNYFKYYFLKFSGLNFDEQLLENDYNKLIDSLLEVPSNFFMYRDFQSRNIMISDNELYYIDFQGGRKGPLQYDLASLLFDAKALLSHEFKQEMLQYYFELLPQEIKKEQRNFKKRFWLFALIRIMQAMGAYGYRGLFEKKQHFIKSIPLALQNLEFVLRQIEDPEFSYLISLLKKLKLAPYIQKYLPQKEKHSLKVNIYSFSYKKGVPKDESEHGGGFIFDCRAIHNPGRYDVYKKLSGKDAEVINFFLSTPSMDAFLAQVYEMVDASVSKYIERDFSNLSVGFGCTGGQHRSVYSAESLKQHLSQKFNINIELYHREKGSSWN